MEDIQNLFKETIAGSMDEGLEEKSSKELGYSKYGYRNKETDNRCNGHSGRTLRTSFGKVGVRVPRDRKGEFEAHIRDIYGPDASDTTVSRIQNPASSERMAAKSAKRAMTSSSGQPFTYLAQVKAEL